MLGKHNVEFRVRLRLDKNNLHIRVSGISEVNITLGLYLRLDVRKL